MPPGFSILYRLHNLPYDHKDLPGRHIDPMRDVPEHEGTTKRRPYHVVYCQEIVNPAAYVNMADWRTRILVNLANLTRHQFGNREYVIKN